MLIGRIRPIETRVVEIPDGLDLTARIAALDAATPAGWELSSRAKGEISRVDGVEEIEADDMDTLIAKVPEGWRLLSVRAV